METIIPFSGLAILALAWLTTRLLLPLIRQANLTSGRLDRPSERKQQPLPVPYGAGLACVLGVLAPVFAGLVILGVGQFVGLPDAILVHKDGLLIKIPGMLAILTGATALSFMGRKDDSNGLSVGIRLAIQFAVALIVALAGIRATLFIDAPALQIAITVLWILFVTNAINFIDNMDGVMPLVAACAAIGILTIATLDGQLFVAAFALSLLGALIGVLSFNWHPASVYMGDEGSMPIGFLLATLVLVLTTTHNQATPGPAPFLIPPLLVLIPAVDACWVICRRIAFKRSPFAAGHDHTAHILSRRGWTPPRVARRFGAISLAACSVAVCIHGMDTAHVLTAGALALPLIASFTGALRGQAQ